ncbi:ribosomal RNA-processing protein 8 isoform X2 [Petaurus breviceps papuanus]|uniref:ribosomal RNA-processing protein 8 isoform X2 n=1 Tax=Petaurus breviceps papuanus TaxID=3040969 RepID=UPI0036DBBFBB
MFEEPEWAEEPPASAALAPPTPRARVRPAPRAKGLSHQRLQATLKALQAEALPCQLPDQGGSDSNSDSDLREKRKKRKKAPKEAPLLEESSKLPVRGVKTKKEESKGSGAPKNGDLAPVLPQNDPGLRRTTLDPVEDGNNTEPRLSRKQWRNRQKNKRRQKNKFLPLKPQNAATPEDEIPPGLTEKCEPELEAEEPGVSLDRAGILRAKMKQRLEGARFRFLNEQLYSVTSSAASHIFQEDPEAFELYHRGFQNQIKRWPLKPVDQIVKDLKQRPASLVVADFGCGDCRLASSVRNTVHCFDLAALDPRVTVCDMAQVPLKDESVDIAVFCLSLMGTNLSDFLKEANRVLKPGDRL